MLTSPREPFLARLVLVAVFALAGCGVGPIPQPLCTPGASVACACTNGATGAQVCDVSRVLTACVCADGGAPIVDAGTADVPVAPVDAGTADVPVAPVDTGSDVPVVLTDGGTPDVPVAPVDTGAPDVPTAPTDVGFDRPDVGFDVPVVTDVGFDRPVVTDVGFDVPRAVDSGPADPCAAATACGGCTAMSSCGWCATTNRCLTGTAAGPRGSTCAAWSWTASQCPSTTDPCRTTGTCTACVGRANCGWCGDSNQCMTGSSGGPNGGSCESWLWNSSLFCR